MEIPSFFIGKTGNKCYNFSTGVAMVGREMSTPCAKTTLQFAVPYLPCLLHKPGKLCLAGGVPTPLKNMKVNGKEYPIYYGK